MYKIAFLISYIFLISNSICAQFFEGKVTYKSTHKAHTTIDESHIKGNRLKTQLYIDGLALPVFSISIDKERFSINETNLVIKKRKNKLEYTNSEYKRLRKKETVLGYECSIYKQKRHTPYGEDIMFYSVADSLKVDNKYGNHWVLNNRIILKSVQKTENGSYPVEAIELKAMQLNDSIFELPDYPIIEVDFEKLSKKVIKEANELLKDD